MKYFIIIVFILTTFISCTYFDPMHGMKYLDYGESYSLTFSGKPAFITNYGVSSYSNIKVDGDNVYLVYLDGHEERLIFSRSQDGGSEWRDATLSSSHCYCTCMDLVEGAIYISYMTGNSLYCIVSYDGGTTIQTTKIDDVVSTGDGFTGITGYENNIYISYNYRQENDLCDVLCAYSKDKGRSFSISVVESSAHLYASASSIDYNPQTEKVYITYQRIESSDLGFAMSSTLDTWETKSFNDTNHQSSRVIAHGSDDIHLVHTGPGPTYYHSTDDGETWPAGVDIDPDCDTSSDISFSKDSSILYTAYYHNNYGQLKVSIYDGGWTAQVVDDEGATGGVEARKCSIDASGTVVFVSYITYTGDLVLSKSTDGGTTWNTD